MESGLVVASATTSLSLCSGGAAAVLRARLPLQQREVHR